MSGNTTETLDGQSQHFVRSPDQKLMPCCFVFQQLWA